MKKEEEKNTANKNTNDADTNAEDNKIIHIDKEKLVTIEEERNNLEYQETMNLNTEKLPVQVNKFGYQYMKLLMIHILKQ